MKGFLTIILSVECMLPIKRTIGVTPMGRSSTKPSTELCRLYCIKPTMVVLIVSAIVTLNFLLPFNIILV